MENSLVRVYEEQPDFFGNRLIVGGKDFRKLTFENQKNLYRAKRSRRLWVGSCLK